MLTIQYFTLLLFVSFLPSESLICYECYCDQNTLAECDCQSISNEDDQDYCIIIEERYSAVPQIQMTRIDRNATLAYIEDPYYILVQESIRYNESNRTWYTKNYGVVFGCDWDYCNDHSLVDTLPFSWQLTIDNAWLDANIYGTGSVSSCPNCPTETCGNKTYPVDLTQCPLTACPNGSSSCQAFDLWTDINTGDYCYQSACAPSFLGEPDNEIYGGKYRLDIESIVYLGGNRSVYDIWELDVFCAAVNCTRPSIFEEIIARLSVSISDLSGFPLSRPVTTVPTTSTRPTPVSNKLQCYECECVGTNTCPCSGVENITQGEAYCVIIFENYYSQPFIYVGYLYLSDTIGAINEFPYALLEESIIYDEGVGRWFTKNNYVVYGCNWNLCNKPELSFFMLTSYELRIPDAWLNSNVLGSGLPARDCHECPDGAECGTTGFISAEKCPIQACNTTCLVMDIYDDPEFDYLCYDSYCLPPDSEFIEYERHRVEMLGIVYASEPSTPHLWEVDIYCRADNCSRPEIFRELRQELRVQQGDLASLFNETYDPTIPQRRCYECNCYSDVDCRCNRTTIMPANSSYCVIVRQSFGQGIYISLDHVDQNSNRLHIREFPYLLVEETISYNESTTIWSTKTNLVVFGCNWDYCNHPRFVQHLPNGFQMRLSDAWLNANVLGNGSPVRDCHECPEAPQCGSLDFLDPGRCPIRQCNTTCLVFDTFNDPAKDEQCYQSFCASPDGEEFQIDTHRVEMEGIIYLNKVPLEVELWEVDIYCRADDCSRPEIFKEVRSNFTTEYGNIDIFTSLTTPVTGITTSSAPVTGTTTTSTPVTGTTASTPVTGTTASTPVTGTTTPSTTTSGTAVILSNYILTNICTMMTIVIGFFQRK